MHNESTPDHGAFLLRILRSPGSSTRVAAGNTIETRMDDLDLSEADEGRLDRSTVRKFDTILLPFLALLFLLNSLDRSNIGNAESADFTKDIGLRPEDLNTAVAVFFGFFVALQPLGAALGRKYGMKRWVPGCMALWGICTALHIWVRTRWQLILLRTTIGILEAGFYPVTVSYLSLFYTRYEFARRLGLFYGQYAVAGALGGILSYAVFSGFTDDSFLAGWKPWQILFLLEGGMTFVIALVGFFWLPHNAGTAWFLDESERLWADERIRRDRRESQNQLSAAKDDDDINEDVESREQAADRREEADRLLIHDKHQHNLAASTGSLTEDRGLKLHDIVSAVMDWKIWFLLGCNILSAVPTTAFSIFLPLVLRPLTSTPAIANLMTAPPFLFGAFVLYTFSYWSDKWRIRLKPILWGLALLMFGLVTVVFIPDTWTLSRYGALCILLSGTFVASPLTIAWLTNNIPEPGKRSVVLGINGWGNLAGVISSLLFAPRFEPDYIVPCFVTLACVTTSFAGYIVFMVLLRRENIRRTRLLRSWTEEQIEAEETIGRGPVEDKGRRLSKTIATLLGRHRWTIPIAEVIQEARRSGDEKMTYQYTF